MAELIVEMLPAGQGDCLLLTANQGATSTTILVDGGTSRTFDSVLRPRLEALAAAGGRIDLLVVSHIDDDHIGGIIRLLEHNGPAEAPLIVPIDEIWHNSYRHLHIHGRTPTATEISRVDAAARRLATGRSRTNEGEISSKQGSTLSAQIRRGGYRWNSRFGGSAVRHTEPPEPQQFGEVQLTVLGPTVERLGALQRRWRRELMSMGVGRDATSVETFEEAFEEVLLAKLGQAEQPNGPVSHSLPTDPPPESLFVDDNSPTNASSIILLVEYHGIRCLLLGDAVVEAATEGLASLGVSEPICVDILKVSHHGSERNTSPALMRAVTARHFLVSTDGSRHGHPHASAMLWILEGSSSPSITFNYPTLTAAHLSSDAIISRYSHEVVIGSGAEIMVLKLPGDISDEE